MSTDPERWLWAVSLIVAWLGLVAIVVWRTGRRKRNAQDRQQTLATGGASVLVVHAGQTGTAEALAWMTAEALAHAGTPARVEALGSLTPEDLRAAGRVLAIVSTTGEGDPPDAMARFAARFMGQAGTLSGLTYGLLALGDRSYRHYCGFGRAVDDWLGRSGATALFDRIEVDDGDADAIRQWQRRLGSLTGGPIQADWSPPPLAPWTLSRRLHLNPGSPGGEIHWLELTADGGDAAWSAGDIAELGLPDDPTIRREYSIASLPGDGHLALLVRRMVGPDGAPGRASGWLTQALQPGETVSLRIRRNSAFHAPPLDRPLILIGNGTGLAGLRAHWRQRQGGPHGGTWLMFGERTADHDRLLDAELQAGLRTGLISRLDRAFSRDPGDGRYVQALIEANGDLVRAWIERGAVILVCGSARGMAESVDTALASILGRTTLLELRASDRYRRDVY